jgi:hypothetical protein
LFVLIPGGCACGLQPTNNKNSIMKSVLMLQAPFNNAS